MSKTDALGSYRTRVHLFTAFVLVVLGVLGARLVQLQLVERGRYAGVSERNAVRSERVRAPRGAIYDRGGTLMVDNEPRYTLRITPRYFDPAKTDLLAALLGVADTTVARKLHEARAWSAFRPSPAFREVPFDVFSRVQERLYELPGVTFEVAQQRRHLTPARAAHALGYVREVTGAELERHAGRGYRSGDLIGKAGLEESFEGYLRGRTGSAFKLVNIHGNEVEPYQNGREDVAPTSGYDVQVTLDSDLQALAESLFAGKRGAAVALDPKSGEILSMVSAPDFDPEVFSRSVSPETWTYLTDSPAKPLFNRATMMGLPPGSTWKPFMALVGLQEGVITPTSLYRDRGGYRLGGRVFSNHAGHAYGAINVREAIRVSSNAFFFNVMMGLDVDTFHDWATRFGFGVKAPMDLAEQSPGLIPDSAYYDRVYPRGWTTGYTINLGIGQGDMVVTPMQLARYVAAVGNGGMLYPPHLVRALIDPATGDTLRPAVPAPQRIPVEPQYFDVVRDGMRRVMEAGTGRGVQIPGIASGGKTGTAQAPGGREDHSVFILFAPYDDPQIAVAVMVENAGFGASVAGPIASLMAEQYLTGRIADTPQRRFVRQRALRAKSQPLPSGDAGGGA